ncbi:MAG: CDP-alcohol phosphatidyltransferase family protein [Candidatus Brockarchaeota archaeon]|nr:CDP-alcohol phosphatidyltransferase family protein [Candidatus Brockarchaeota archaeon]MBO3768774.1 CDP-alcohol phosphatidyltransferase family protein [Candidatus Brockarchaeota archaeon]MBO3802212.1 CDP-alcohol phosphatidyltransferase family protein [Candidatus Brockarchaeota archaeon]
MLGKLRKISRKIFYPLAKLVGSFGIKPNLITLSGLLVTSVGGLFLVFKLPLIAAFCFLASGLLDLLDGLVARMYGKKTKFGGTLDAVVDRYEEFIMVIASAIGKYISWPIATFAVFSMIAPSYVRARAESTGGMKKCDVGFLERPEKLLFIVLATVGLVFYSKALDVAFLLIIVLGQITVVQRLTAAFNFEKSKVNKVVRKVLRRNKTEVDGKSNLRMTLNKKQLSDFTPE